MLLVVVVRNVSRARAPRVTPLATENPLARADLYRQEVLMRVPTLQRIDKKILDENDFKEVLQRAEQLY